MKTYFVRSAKFFCATGVLALLLIGLMVATGTAAATWTDWHRFAVLFGFLVLFAAVYPKMTFIARHVAGSLGDEGKPIVLNAFHEAGYELASEKKGVLTFRARSTFRRWRRLFDDGITIAQEGDRLRIEGHRAELFRVLYHWDAYTAYEK